MKISRLNLRHSSCKGDRVLLLAVAAGLALAAASCRKDDKAEPSLPGETVFTAATESHEGDGKTHMGDNKDVLWNVGDKIAVYNQDGTQRHEFTAKSGGATTTEFEAAAGDNVTDEFYTSVEFNAFYPAGSVTRDGSGYKMTIPRYQTYVENGFANDANPMAAKSGTTSLEFKNVCGLLQLQLKGEDFNVGAIHVKSLDGDKLSGTGTVTWVTPTDTDDPGTAGGYQVPKLTLSGDDCSDLVSLLCIDSGNPNGVALGGTAKTFYIVVPAGALQRAFTVDVVSADDGCYGHLLATYNPSKPHHIVRSKIRPMEECPVQVTDDGKLWGEFSVSNDGGTTVEKVHFSKGNMYWDENNSSYKFEANQYDYRMHYSHSGQEAVINGVVGSTPTNTVGSLVWVSNKQTSPNPYDWDPTVPDGEDTDVLFTNADATTPNPSFTVNGQAGVWRALSGGTNGEWAYLLNVDNGDGLRNKNWARFAKAEVMGVNGLLVFPDGIAVSDNTATIGGVEVTDVNQKGIKSFQAITDAGWLSLESAGVVFLPCAGYRSKTSVKDVGSNGAYWSSSPRNTFAYGVGFDSGSVSPVNYGGRFDGRSVRLVR